MSGGGGSAGGGGYNLQARMIALVGVHILSSEPLAWLEMQQCQDIPCAVSVETGGAGDDFCIELLHTNVTFEVQAKRGLSADGRLNETLDHFVSGLIEDPFIHCILAIDPTASKPVQTHLLDDLNRLRQGRKDRLHPVTQKVLRHLESKGAHRAHELAQRISLHVFDVERQPTNERLNALLLLKRVLRDPNQAEATWSTLIDDAMQLIQHRGRRDAQTLVGLLNSHHLHLIDTLSSTAFPRYLSWLKETTATFHVPGLGVRLPIDHAWANLQALDETVEMERPATLEAKLASYHEWERLSYSEHSYSAQDVTELGHRVVVIGGPGAGKSTLCQRTAHRLADSGERVLRVRLPFVAQRCFTDGESIDQAILSVATAGSDIRLQALLSTFNAPDCLIADGLDECGAYIVEIAEQLRIWAYARPRTRVVVATRPIGYDRAFFDDWKHVELLPLGSDRIEGHVKNILMHVETDRVELERKIRQFQSQIKINRIASMAARSPLLLGFLVQLVHHDIAFARHRAALYDQVLTLWYQTPPKERRVAVPEPGTALAREVLNRAGWFLHPASSRLGRHSRREVIDALALQLRENGQSLLAAKEKVERCLAFWQERGVLELLQVGNEDAYTFIHAILGEYAAGCYLATCDDNEILTHLENVRHDARWRETILLAAGAGKAHRIAEHLLSLDRDNDPVATESLLAAAVLAESAQASPALAVEVAEHITNRLCSTIPLVAYESAQNSTGLAAQLAEQMRPLLHPLLRHPQLWTRLTALRLALAAGDSVVDLDALEVFFDDWLAPEGAFEPGESPPLRGMQDIRKYILGRREPWGTFNEVLGLGAEVLVRLRPGEATALRLERLARLKWGINNPAIQTLLQGLKRLGHDDTANQIWEEYMGQHCKKATSS